MTDTPNQTAPAGQPNPADRLPATTIAVLMGVTGSGKTTIGQLLASRTGLQFADADDYHPESNKQKLAAGQPLTDADREPWLERLNHLLLDWNAAAAGGALACSALKTSYRSTLSKSLPADAVRFVLLEVPRALLQQRLAQRHHPFMNPDLLDSQIATLEQPGSGEALVICNDRSPDQVVTELIAGLRAAPATPAS